MTIKEFEYILSLKKYFISEFDFPKINSKGYKVCLDDRNYLIGEKIKDNELFGIRKTIIIGNSYLNNGNFEFEDRKTNLRQILSENEIYSISVQ